MWLFLFFSPSSESIWENDNHNRVKSNRIILNNPIRVLNGVAVQHELDHSYALSPDSEPKWLWRLVSANKDIDHTYAMGYWEKVTLSEVMAEAKLQPDLLLFRCTKCLVLFNKKSLLIRHMKVMHAISIPLECNRCSRKFWQKDQLNKHQCQFQEQIDVVASFYEKFRKEINGHQLYKCDLCSFSMPLHRYGLNSFQRHYNLHFTGIDVLCNKCPKKFPTLAALNTRIDIMHQQINYRCFDCGKMFQHLSNLTKVKTHIPFLHKKKKKLRCPKCDKPESMLQQIKTFTQRTRVHIHVYVCPMCNKEFKTNKYFILHCSKKHNMMLEAPQLCYPLPALLWFMATTTLIKSFVF